MPQQSAPRVAPTTVLHGPALTQSQRSVGHYFRPKHEPRAFKFASVRAWNDFDLVLARNLERAQNLGQTARFMTTQEIALTVVGPLLAQMGLSIAFVDHRPEHFPFIGSADLILCITSAGLESPLLVGHNHSDLALDFDIVGRLQEPPFETRAISNHCHLGDLRKDLKLQRTEEIRALQELCHVMVINDLAFGYLSSEVSTRFVNIVSQPHGLDLCISEPVNSHQICGTLTAISLEAYYRPSHLRYHRGFEAFPEVLEDPDIEPLSSFDKGSAGKIKWWLASRMNRHRFTISIDHRASRDADPRYRGAYLAQHAAGVCRYGEVTIDDVKTLPTLLKISTDRALIHREASMLQYLLEKGMQRVPKLVLYAHLLGNEFHVLSLEPFGHLVTGDDVMVPEVAEQMFVALEEVHMFGVMLLRVTVGAFAVQYTTGPRETVPFVRLISFTDAKLFRRIPGIARELERSQLRAAIDEAKVSSSC